MTLYNNLPFHCLDVGTAVADGGRHSRAEQHRHPFHPLLRRRCAPQQTHRWSEQSAAPGGIGRALQPADYRGQRSGPAAPLWAR